MKPNLTLVTALLLAMLSVARADVLAPFDLREVKVGGEIGRRIAITVTNNLLKLDVDGEFLPVFKEEPRTASSSASA